MMRELKEQWKTMETRVVKVQRDCKHFGKPEPKLAFYSKMKDEIDEQQEAWSLFDDFNKELGEFKKEEWLTFRKQKYFAFQDFFLGYGEKLRQAPKSVVQRFILEQIEEFKKAWPLIKLCTGESFEKEHWRKLISMLKMPKEVTFDNMIFGNIVDSVPTLILKTKDLKELVDRALGEVTIREAINELRIWCDSTEFELTEYKSNDRTTPLVKEWKEIITAVSDHQSLIISLKESRFFSSFAEQIEALEKRFSGVDNYLAQLNVCQRKWVYLEPIFMRGALPQELGRFRRVDEEYRGIACGIGADQKVMSLCEIPGLKDTLETILAQLDMCQKALNDYLEEKRQKFSRFYFIGDDDLLEILGQGKRPEIIQSHLKKLFSGIFKVAFNKENTSIKSMVSSANEYVELAQPI
jgi:dynein heavy chain 2